MTKKQRTFQAIAEGGCLICRIFENAEDVPAQCHHIREHTGLGKKSPDCDALPICQEHHDEFHRGRKSWIAKYGKQSDLLIIDRSMRTRP